MANIDMESVNSRLYPLRASGARPPLFCVHAIDGSVSEYSDMVAAMQADRPVYGVIPPKLDEDRLFLSVQELAEIYIDDVRKLQKHGPYQLSGLSFGGLVAYEMARMLLNEREDVQLLALFDTCHPAYRRNLPPKRLLKFNLTYLVDRLKKYIRNVISGKVDSVMADALKFIRPRMTRFAWETTRLVFRIFRTPLPKVMRSDSLSLSAAWRTYTPGMYQGRLVLFRAEEQTVEYAGDLTLGWEVCVTGGVDVHAVPGDHISMMKLPNVRGLVDKLTPYLAVI